MFDSIYKNAKHTLISLRFSILSIFVTLYIISMMIIIALNYVFSSKTLLFTASQLMHEVSTSLYDKFSQELKQAEKDDALSAKFVEHGIISQNNFEQIINYTYELAARFYLVQAAYWVDEQGNYVITKYEPDDSLTTIIFDKSKSLESKQIIYRDIQGNDIKTETNPFIYDPRIRPWYLTAKNQKKTIWTDIYLFTPTPYLGITVATPVFINNHISGVFGLDIRLDWLSWYVGEQKIGEHGLVFILTTTGKVIAFPGFDKLTDQTKLFDVHELDTQWIAKSFDIYKENTQKNEFDFSYQGKSYLAVYKPIPDIASKGWIIGIVVPRDDFVGELKKSSLTNIIISLAILIIFIFIVSALITRVVSPLKKLVKQTEKIKNFELEEDEYIQSRVKEVMLLSDALHAMRIGLQSFQKYVPASLVRQLIEADENVRVGGSKRQLVVLFSDIKNFTVISENMDPQQLMIYMCEYFDALSNIIVEEKGTIDKYIGDSIMAFWGAPLLVDQPSHHAAKAALKCKNKLTELNKMWLARENITLFTRFGIHLGDAIVGNVGSAERMNYTAVGDTINMSSRLEGVNKLYGTQILVSEDVFVTIKNDFVLRFIDSIAVKGKTKIKNVYELLAINKEELSFDIDSYQNSFERAFSAYRNQNWEDAINLFNQCLLIYPQDSIAPIFISRCKNFKNNPPGKNWDGVWRNSY